MRTIAVRIRGATPLMGPCWTRDHLESGPRRACCGELPEQIFRPILEPTEETPWFGYRARSLVGGMVRSVAEQEGRERKEIAAEVWAPDPDEVLPIEAPEPTVQVERIRIRDVSMSSHFWRFDPWSLWARIAYDEDRITEARIVEGFRDAGARFGIGIWRPQRGGRFGRYEVTEVREERQGA